MELWRKHNSATSVYFPMIKAGSQDFAVGGDWTPVAADTKFSIDGGAFANTGSTPVHEGQGIWSLALLDSEVNGAVITIVVVDAATKAVEDQAIIIATYGNASAEIRMDFDDAVRAGLTAMPNVNAGVSGGLPTIDAGLRVKADVERWLSGTPDALSSGKLPADIKLWLTGAVSALVSGRVDASTGAMSANVLTAASIATNALTSAKIATDAIGAAQIAASAALEIADAILNRDIDQVEGSAPVHSLTTAVLKAVSRIRDNSGVLQIFRTDGSTVHASQTLIVDATNLPIDEVSVAT